MGLKKGSMFKELVSLVFTSQDCVCVCVRVRVRVRVHVRVRVRVRVHASAFCMCMGVCARLHTWGTFKIGLGLQVNFHAYAC